MSTQVIPPNEEMLAIAKLFLEKVELLSPEERAEYLLLLRGLNRPILMLEADAPFISTGGRR